jgi:hypothetical protein
MAGLDDIDWAGQDFDTASFPPPNIQARRAGLAAQGANSDEAAKAFELAPKVGLPPAFVQMNMPGFADQVQLDQNAVLTDQHPQLAAFVSDPAVAKATKDDYPALAQIANFMDPGGLSAGGPEAMPSNPVEALTGGYQSGFAQTEYGRLAYKYMKGDTGVANRLKEYEDAFAGETKYTGFDSFLQSIGGLAGQLTSSVGASAPEVAGGGVIGSLVPGVGTAAGMAAGLTAGIARDAFITSAGQHFRSTEGIRDENGKPIPEGARKAVALGVGAVNASLMAVAPELMKSGIGAVIGESAAKALAQPGVASAIYRMTTGLGLAGLEFGSLNAGMEVSNILATEIAKAASDGNFKTVLNDPATRTEAIDRTADALKNGLLLGPALALTPLGTNYLHDRISIVQARADGERRLSTVGAMEVAKTAQQSKELARQYYETFNRPPVKVAAEAVAENKEAFSYIPDLELQLQRELPSGGDIIIDNAQYHAFTDFDVQKAINDRVSEVNGLSPEDADILEKQPPKYVGVPDEAGLSVATQGEEVEGRVPTKLGFVAPEAEAFTNPAERRIFEAHVEAQNSLRRALWLDPIIEPEAAGLSKIDFERYSRHVQEVQRKLVDNARKFAEAEIRRRETPLWKNELAKEVQNAREDLTTRPDIEAYRFITTAEKDSPFKLDRNEVDGLLNRESQEDYENFKKGKRASEDLPAKLFGPNGVHPDEAADYLKFNSAKEMLDALRKYEADIRASGKSERAHFADLAQAEGARRMEEKNGKLQEKIIKESLEHALGVQQIEVLTDELRGMGANEKITRANVEAKVREIFAAKDAKGVRAADYDWKVSKFGREAERALLAKKPAEALMAKQRQLISAVMAREARAFEKERARTQAIVDRYSKNVTLEGVNQDFTDQLHNILRFMDVSTLRRSDESIDRNIGRTTFRDFIRETEQKYGWEVQDTDWLHVQPGDAVKAYKTLTVAEFREISKTLESLNELGRRVDKVETATKEFAYDTAVPLLIEPLDKRERERVAKGREIDDEPATMWQKAKHDFRSLDALAIKMEQLALWNDTRDPLGAWNTLIFRPIKEAQHARDDYLKKVGKQVADLPVTKDWTASLNDTVPHNEFFDDEQHLVTSPGETKPHWESRPIKITRKKFLAMILNSGNEGNLRVLAHTLNSTPDEVRAFIGRNIRPDEIKLANAVWKIFEGIRPDLEAMMKRVTGVVPDRVRAVPHNGLDGGYFPLMRDPRGIVVDPNVTVNRAFYNAVTDSNASHERTGALYQLDLTLDRLPYALRETIHDIHMREPVAQVARFLADPLIRKAMDRAWGHEYTAQMMPWIRHVANDGEMFDPNALAWAASKSRYFRQNMVTSLVGGRMSTAIIHGTSALGNSMSEVGLRPFLMSTVHLLSQNPFAEASMWRQDIQSSGELRNRMHNMYLDINQQIPAMLDQSKRNFARAAYQAFATKLIAYLDMASAVVVYHAKLEKALNEGMSRADATYTADQAVRVAHGSLGLADVPGTSRGGEAVKWGTAFYGYFNHNYQRIRDSGKLIKEGDYWQAVSRSMGYLLVPALNP